MNAGAGGPFNLVFADPPYRKEMLAPALVSLKAGGWLTEGAVLVLELAEDETLSLPDGFTFVEERVYGEAKVVFATA